ncbi:MAG: hypothetical protein K9K64_07625 [Desulfohalobiaceae bacterium]|nr:hypothetical protein [Desulfohalobiaceae bacterium]
MTMKKILEITGYGAWQGGRVVGNAMFEDQNMFFKGGIPVTDKTIQERIGVKSRKVASAEERIGVTAFQDLLRHPDFDPSRLKVIIGATNVGDSKYETEPQVRNSFELVKEHSPGALVFDLYAGCPGFNVSVELLFMLSLSGYLQEGDISVIIGAENIHRAQSFPPGDTANIIFGDDALATSLETRASLNPQGSYFTRERKGLAPDQDLITGVARAIHELIGDDPIDGLIVDNQLGNLVYRIPAFAARVQHRLVELRHPGAARAGVFARFKEAYAFYQEQMKAFAFDINTLDKNPETVKELAAAYVRSGKQASVLSVFLRSDQSFDLTLHQGKGYVFNQPEGGVVDAMTRTHGCFGDYIRGVKMNGDVYGEMDGKGVFLYGTRSAPVQLTELLGRNRLRLADIDLLIEHQANFAMIFLTLEQLLKDSSESVKKDAARFMSLKMVNNIHKRGNCSVVCMQRLPYDLEQGALEPAEIQGVPINANLKELQSAGTILYDSVGSGMTRSSFLYQKLT